jgi:hypothetical protein
MRRVCARRERVRGTTRPAEEAWCASPIALRAALPERGSRRGCGHGARAPAETRGAPAWQECAPRTAHGRRSARAPPRRRRERLRAPARVAPAAQRLRHRGAVRPSRTSPRAGRGADRGTRVPQRSSGPLGTRRARRAQECRSARRCRRDRPPARNLHAARRTTRGAAASRNNRPASGS